ncbi:lysosomal acid phosphatase-like isoform X1 [Uranotaenia lowii]|uniref:lysosomal acid phosphatase-like isoform X1 n=1 Tax=Uranotaenia lowii TaxID=190385 RepID=UPI0024785C4E|nr:lysosomal acid phosphatase-like isoform X1 [Uranotaenia lowii]
MVKFVVCLLFLSLTSSAPSWCDAASSFSSGSLRSLQMAILMFRHGDRSPITTYPTDPHKDYPWIGGYVALQPKGIQHMYELGKSLRSRYGILLPDHGMYTKNTTLVVSSASERCVLSAQSLMASFYQPPKNANLSIGWQPVPLEVLSFEDDIILGQRRNCPKLDAVRQVLLESPTAEFAEWHRKGMALKDYISEQTNTSIPTFNRLFEICDALQIQHENGLYLPHWAAKIFPEQASEFSQGYLLTFSATDELKKIRGGAILKDLVEKLKAKRDGTLSPNRSLFFYSAHDAALSNLCNTLGLESLVKKRAEYGATVVFELYETLGNDMEVRIIYYPTTSTKVPVQIDIPNCGKPCSLTNFERSVKHWLLNDYDEACKISQ